MLHPVRAGWSSSWLGSDDRSVGLPGPICVSILLLGCQGFAGISREQRNLPTMKTPGWKTICLVLMTSGNDVLPMTVRSAQKNWKPSKRNPRLDSSMPRQTTVLLASALRVEESSHRGPLIMTVGGYHRGVFAQKHHAWTEIHGVRENIAHTYNRCSIAAAHLVFCQKVETVPMSILMRAHSEL